jgi:serine/threonine-protein kinase
VQGGAAATLVLVAVVALVMWRGIGGGADDAPAAAEAVTASAQDQAVPTGLTISRSATYDPEARAVDLTITYAAQNAPLGGPFLEVVGGLEGDQCPAVTWQGDSQERNLPSVSGVDAPCSYSVDPGPVPRQGSVSVTARVGLALPADDPQTTLAAWLDDNGAATVAAVSDPELSSTSYPAQRLQDVQVVAPSRTVSGKTLPITLVPVWPSGPDPVNPLYRSPSVGRPSSLLSAVAGGEQGVRFSDACSGALAVSADGLVVTALSVAPECEVDATVGNFTTLRSNSFAIATRGG